MKRVFVADLPGNFCNCHIGLLKQGTGFGHPVFDNKLLRRFSGAFLEDLSKIGPVDAEDFGDAFHRNVICEILLNIMNGFFYIVIAHLSVA